MSAMRAIFMAKFLYRSNVNDALAGWGSHLLFSNQGPIQGTFTTAVV